jgi:hypothetical protein
VCLEGIEEGALPDVVNANVALFAAGKEKLMSGGVRQAVRAAVVYVECWMVVIRPGQHRNQASLLKNINPLFILARALGRRVSQIETLALPCDTPAVAINVVDPRKQKSLTAVVWHVKLAKGNAAFS